MTITERKKVMRHGFWYSLGVVAALSLVSAAALAAYAPLELDRVHSKVGFTAATVLFDVDGQFTKYDVQIEGDAARPETVRVRATIDVDSIDTQNTKRDNHLKSDDFFDAAKHPKITFTSTSIKGRGDQVTVKGNLSMRGKTKLVTIPFKVARGNNGAGIPTTTYKGKLTVDRNDFGIGTDDITAKISLEDDVDIKLVIVTLQP